MSTKQQFLDFVFNTQISSDTPIEEEKKVVSELFYKSWDIVPSRLFRYRQCNKYNYDALDSDKFLLTKPVQFNDPYDSLIYVNKKLIYNQLLEPPDVDLIEKLNQDEVFKKEEIERFGEEYIEKLIKSGGFKSKEEKIFYTTLSKKIYSKFINELIDLALTTLKQSTLVGCLSERFDSILMWSHYAENHTGFVLGYDFKERFSIKSNKDGNTYSEFVDKKIFPIRYSNERYDATEYISNNFIYNFHVNNKLPITPPFFDKLFYYKYLLYKSSEWRYEKEWRIIKQTGLDKLETKSNFDFIHHIIPKEIYLGSKISKWDEKILRNIAEKKNIRIYKMDLEYFNSRYKLSKSELL